MRAQQHAAGIYGSKLDRDHGPCVVLFAVVPSVREVEGSGAWERY